MAAGDTKEDQSKTLTDPKQLTTVYKKNGGFDNQRKLLLEDFKQSQTYKNLLLKLEIIVEQKVKNDPTILNKNKGKMAALIQGEIINNHNKDKSDRHHHHADSILSVIEKDIQSRIIDSKDLHNKIHEDVSKIRREMLGISEAEYEETLQANIQRKQEAQLNNPSQTISGKSYKNNYKINNINDRSRISKPRFNLHNRSYQPTTRVKRDEDEPNDIDLMY